MSFLKLAVEPGEIGLLNFREATQLVVGAGTVRATATQNRPMPPDTASSASGALYDVASPTEALAIAARTTATSITWSASVATVTTADALPAGDALQVVVTGAPGFEGSFAATVTGTDTFTYPLTAEPAASATAGNVIILRASPIAVLQPNAAATGLDIQFTHGLCIVPGTFQKASVAIVPAPQAFVIS